MSIVVLLGFLLFSFPVNGVGGAGVPVHLFFVVCYCFLDRFASCLVPQVEIGSFM